MPTVIYHLNINIMKLLINVLIIFLTGYMWTEYVFESDLNGMFLFLMLVECALATVIIKDA